MKGLTEFYRLAPKPYDDYTVKQYINPVLCEVTDDPFGPPTFIYVAFVCVNNLSLDVTLKGYRVDEDMKMVTDAGGFFAIDTTANGFRVVKEITVG